MGKKLRQQFVVVSKGRQSLIGASDSERLALVTRECGVRKVCTIKENLVLTSAEIKKEYPDIFKGLGCLEGTCKIHLRQNYRPSVYPARKVPPSQKQKLKKELDRLVQTEVVLPLVIVEKPNGDLRLCLDPMDLNEYIRREHYHLPNRSEILSEMADARYFTKMDASQGFYQIQLDEESTQLCTVATPFGGYSFKRLPYGINCAPEIFHAKIQQLFESETGVKVFMDDTVVWGRTREEHDARLKKALATIRRSGLKLNEKKCVFGVTELTYLGEKLTHQGIKPDPDKVAGSCNMPVPTTKEEVQRALGMVNYMAKFVPNLTVKTTALRQLLLEKND